MSLVSGELLVRVRDNANVDRVLSDVATHLENLGVFVTELSARNLSFTVDPAETRRAGSDLEFLRAGGLVALPRGPRLLIRYHVQVNTPPWGLLIAGAAVMFLIALKSGPPRGGLRLRFTLPLPVISMASLGNRAAMKRRVRQVLAEAIDSQPGLDC